MQLSTRTHYKLEANGVLYFAEYDQGDEIWNLYDEPGGQLLGNASNTVSLEWMADDLSLQANNR
jgi:hypothetical protein